MLDIKITGGDLLDGTGSPPVRADVGVTGDTIAAVGDLSAAESRLTLDLRATPPTCAPDPASRLPHSPLLCPGFIDAHSHSDAYLLIEPSAPSKIFQGVTTEIVGNCGASAAPRVGEARIPSDWTDKPLPGTWRTVAEYVRLLEQVRPAPNAVLLVGHNTLRTSVCGCENRPATSPELSRMKDLLDQSMDEGGRGLSSGLIYVPGRFAPAGELVELAAVVGRRGGVYATHMRSEGAGLLDAIEETIRLAETAGTRAQISHLKTSGPANWEKLDRALDLIRQARRRGVDIAADRYPYVSGYTDLDVVFPDWAAAGGGEAVLNRLRNPSDRARLRADLAASRPHDDWRMVTIGSTRHPENRRFRGVPLTDVAAALGVEPVDAVLHLADTDELRTSAFFFGMSEPNMRRILAEPYVMIGSDASIRAPDGPLSEDYPHPRAYGTFPRFLRMALDGETVGLAESVRKMTSLPASHFGLPNRGIVRPGMKADLVAFDPATVRDLSTYTEPHRLAQGVTHVMVNGVLTLADGRLTGRRAGRLL